MTLFDDQVSKDFNVKWNPKDLTFSILDGIARFTPEMVRDLETYYAISPRQLFQFVKDVCEETENEEEVDIKVSFVAPFRPESESICRIELYTFGSREILADQYFSGPAIKPANVVVTK